MTPSEPSKVNISLFVQPHRTVLNLHASGLSIVAGLMTGMGNNRQHTQPLKVPDLFPLLGADEPERLPRVSAASTA